MSYLNDVLQNLIGTYSPIVTQLSDGSENVQVDYVWIASACILIICLYSIFRIIGGLLCKQ